MQLNKDQQALLDSLNEFYASTEQFFLLSGQAGVGKTTCMRHFVQNLKIKYSGLKICMSAPTNKATGVLKRSVGDSLLVYKTVYSLLGLRMMANGDVKELRDSGQDSVGNYDLIVIDEGSMCSSILLDYLLKKTSLADVKIVFIGDREQLPPVNEEYSPIWKKFSVNYELTEVMRHQNSILDFVQSIRANPSPKFESPGNQVFIDDEDRFINEIDAVAMRGDFHSGKAKAIAWRNVTVDFLNNHIRCKYTKTKNVGRFAIGDRVIFKEPVFLGERPLAAVDDEGEVISVSVSHHNTYANLKAWFVTIKLDETNSTVTAHVVHEDSEIHLQNMLDDFKNKKHWQQFWKLKEAFHSIAYAYALTAHRSQGSTFETVFVDAGDILINRDVDSRTKCLYVAASRASKNLHLFP